MGLIVCRSPRVMTQRPSGADLIRKKKRKHMTVLELEPRELFFGNTKTTNFVCSIFIYLFILEIREHGLGVFCTLFIAANGLAHKIVLFFLFFWGGFHFFADFS